MTKHALCAATALSIALAGPPARAEAPPSLEQQASEAFWWGDFERLEQLRAGTRGQRNEAGAPLVAEVRDGLRKVWDAEPSGQSTPDAYFTELEALTLQWAQDNPRSAFAHVLHADALYQHAWAIRGNGFANTVHPQAWAGFERYVREAASYLTAHADVALKDTSAHTLLVNIGRDSGWPRERLWDIARDAYKVDPEDDEVFFRLLHASLPKWGGSAAAVDRLVKDIVELTKARQGQAMYARLYRYAAVNEFAAGLFTQSGAEWSRMEAGFRDQIARYPAPTNINSFAYFACLARDKATTLDLLEQVGDKPVLARWGKNPQRTFDDCKRWASQQ